MQKLFVRGFTMIELLVVIAIIGLFATVILAALSGAREEGTTASAQQTMKNLQSSALLCVTDSSAINLPAGSGEGDTNTGIVGGSPTSLCASLGTINYLPLPSGWIYCDNDAGEAQGAAGCGNETSVQTAGVSFRLVAESNTSHDIITCDENKCLKTNEATPN